MNEAEILEIAARGEDSLHQFKRVLANEKQAAAEMAAFANARGGRSFIGVADDGSIPGLTPEEVRRQNAIVAAAAAQHVRNPLSPFTEVVPVAGRVVIVVTVPEGVDKPYFDADGVIWQKMGADKRRITSKEELRRLFQSSDVLAADEVPVRGCPISELDRPAFKKHFESVYADERLPEAGPEFEHLLTNLGLAQDGMLTLSGLLLFGQNPQRFKPAFVVKAVRFAGTDVTGTEYLDSEDFGGRLEEQFRGAVSFVMRNLPKRQCGQSVNSLGKPEVPREVWEELVANALLRRNYFLSAPVRILFFDDRVELLSPGSLPNHLTVEKIQRGLSSFRNPILGSFAAAGLIVYRGLGTGIRRAQKLCPGLRLENDPDGNQFTAIVPLST
jgi:ATP-dependent DNA helicase RecG